MGDFILSWLIVSISLLGLFYLYSKMSFFRTLYKTLSLETQELKEMIEEDRVIIELYEFEIAKHLSSIDYLQNEIVETQSYLKDIRGKNTRLRNEVTESNEKLATMKEKLDALF